MGACGPASRPFRPGATRSPPSASTKPPVSCGTTGCRSPASAAAACFPPKPPPAGRPISTTTCAPSTKRRRSMPIAWCWSSADCPASSKDLPGARADGQRRHRRHAAPCQGLGRPDRHRAAAPDVCRRPRLREHHRSGARYLRRRWAKPSASPSTSIMSGGTPIWRKPLRAPDR